MRPIELSVFREICRSFEIQDLDKLVSVHCTTADRQKKKKKVFLATSYISLTQSNRASSPQS